MIYKLNFIVFFIFAYLLIAQTDEIESTISSEEKTVQGAFGAVTIDGKIWNQIALRPVLPFGKLAIAFDMVLYIDQDGNVHDEGWDFSTGENVKNTIIDKIYYIRYGNRWDKNYFKIGALDNVSLGYGILLNNYSNTLLYPQVRKVGMEFKTSAFGTNIHGFTNDFKENFGLTGLRVSAPIPYGFNLGITVLGDRNQYLGLRDRDDDGIPDLVDDFPTDATWYLDTDGDGLADNDTLREFDVDGDGLTDSSYTWPLWNIVIDNDGVIQKPEPININDTSEPIHAFALDTGIPIFDDGALSVEVYAQYAALLGETIRPDSGGVKDTVSAGFGLIPFGLGAKFGPAKFNFEFRMVPKGKFEFGYFDRSYEIERATFQSISGNQGTIVTKSQKLGTYGPQNGFYSSLKLDLGRMLDAGMSYQSLNGQMFDEIDGWQESANQSFTAVLKLKKSISKIEKATWFYQQRNVPNPFDFEYSESTITGYNIGLNLGNGMVLNYVFRRTFQDLNGDGKVDGEGEMINMTSIETSFSF